MNIDRWSLFAEGKSNTMRTRVFSIITILVLNAYVVLSQLKLLNYYVNMQDKYISNYQKQTRKSSIFSSVEECNF